MIEEIRKLLAESNHSQEELEVLLKKIAAEIGRATVPKKEFNAKTVLVKDLREQLREKEDEIRNLREAVGATESFMTRITSEQKKYFEESNKLKGKLEALSLEHALDMALHKEGARNMSAVKALIKPLQISLNPKSEIEGIEEQLMRLKETDPYLFISSNEKKAASLDY